MATIFSGHAVGTRRESEQKHWRRELVATDHGKKFTCIGSVCGDDLMEPGGTIAAPSHSTVFCNYADKRNENKRRWMDAGINKLELLPELVPFKCVFRTKLRPLGSQPQVCPHKET
ncbi:unnamed protein product [Spodoptera exigua]|nr:unnamed protein product [Spodoptera exigua]